MGGFLMQGRLLWRFRSVRLTLAIPLAAFVLAGCGGTSSSSSSLTTSASGSSGTAKPLKFALALQLTANSFMQTLAAGSTDAAHSVLGVSLNVTGAPAPNPPTQISDLSQVVTSGVDGVTVDPGAATLFMKALGNAAAQTRVNTVNDAGIQGTRGSNSFVGINQYQASRALLNVVFSRLPANLSGTIVLGNCIPGSAGWMPGSPPSRPISPRSCRT